MSTIGEHFIQAVIEDNSPSLLRRTSELFFLEEELPLVTFVKDYQREFRCLPTRVILRENGFSLGREKSSRKGGADYYAEELSNRYAYNAVNEMHPDLADCLRTRDMRKAQSVLREMVSAIGSARRDNQYTTIEQAARGVMRVYLRAKKNPGLTGITMGWPTADEATNGMEGGDLIVLAGRPAMGKSWELIHMANSAWDAGHSVAVVSMEMGETQLTRRWLGLRTGINPNMIRSGMVATWAERRMKREITSFGRKPPVHLLSGDMNKEMGGVEEMLDEFDPDIL